jgi:hypothetical protein
VIWVLKVQHFMRTSAGQDANRIGARSFPGTDVDRRIADIHRFVWVEPQLSKAFEHWFRVGFANFDIFATNNPIEYMPDPPAIKKGEGTSRGGCDPETQPVRMQLM